MNCNGQDKLSDRVHPHRVLGHLMTELGSVVRADFAGVAIRAQGDDKYRVISSVDRRRDALQKTNDCFGVSETCAAWVEGTALPFVGNSTADLERFPGTARDMARYGFRSNAVLPMTVDQSTRSVFYCLSGQRSSFSLDSLAVLARVRRIIEPVTQAWLAARALEDGSDPVAQASSDSWAQSESADATPTLADVERDYIASVLDRCNRVIDGPRGAARRLGLPPSTLRSRLDRLGLR